jgi:hypothetical protein
MFSCSHEASKHNKMSIWNYVSNFGQNNRCLICFRDLNSKSYSTVECNQNSLYFVINSQVLREERPTQLCVTWEARNFHLTLESGWDRVLLGLVQHHPVSRIPAIIGHIPSFLSCSSPKFEFYWLFVWLHRLGINKYGIHPFNEPEYAFYLKRREPLSFCHYGFSYSRPKCNKWVGDPPLYNFPF